MVHRCFVDRARLRHQIIVDGDWRTGGDHERLSRLVEDGVDDVAQSDAFAASPHECLKRVAFDCSQAGAGTVEHRRSVGCADGRLAAATNDDRFRAAGITGVLVRFDNAGCQKEVAFDTLPVDDQRYAVDDAKIDETVGIERIVVNNPVTGNDGRSQFCQAFGGSRRAMQTGGADQGDVLRGDPARLEFIQETADQVFIGAGAGRVGKGNGHAHAWSSEIGEAPVTDVDRRGVRRRRGYD
jgi:hypothetical protein